MLDPRIEAVRKEYGLSTDDFWQIKQNRQWVCKHAALEVVAVKAKIDWLPPQIIEANAPSLVTSMVVTGRMGDRTEWATGETNPTNYSVTGKQPAYPWAMSEKRAKDRVILKLVGIHGLVYSDAEMDTAPSTLKRDLEDSVALEAASKNGAKWSTPVDKQREIWATLRDELDACPTVDDLAVLWKSKAFQDEFKQLQPGWQDLLTERKDELKAGMMQPANGHVAPNFDHMETAK